MGNNGGIIQEPQYFPVWSKRMLAPNPSINNVLIQSQNVPHYAAHLCTANIYMRDNLHILITLKIIKQDPFGVNLLIQPHFFSVRMKSPVTLGSEGVSNFLCAHSLLLSLYSIFCIVLGHGYILYMAYSSPD